MSTEESGGVFIGIIVGLVLAVVIMLVAQAHRPRALPPPPPTNSCMPFDCGSTP